MKNDKNFLFINNISRWSRYNSNKLKRLRDTPHSIAIGAAIGVFWGVFPTFMLGLLLAIGVAALFKVNKTAAGIGTFIMNPITTPFFWTISAYIGGLVTNTDWLTILKLAKNFGNGSVNLSFFMKTTVWIYLLGNTIVAVLFSYFTYFLVLIIVSNYQNKRAQKLASLNKK